MTLKSQSLLAIVAASLCGAMSLANAGPIILPFEADQTVTMPGQFAVPVEAGQTIENSGTWTTVGAVSTWTLQFKAPGAASMSAYLEDIMIAPGATLRVGSLMPTLQSGARSSYRSWPESGDTIEITLTAPANERGRSSLRVHTIFPGLVQIGGDSTSRSIAKSDEDLVDLDPVNYACVRDQTDQHEAISRATAFIVVGPKACSGSLMNHDDADDQAWLLTAAHCGDDYDRGTGAETAGGTLVARFNAIAPCSEGIISASDSTTATSFLQGISTVYSDVGDTGDASVANDLWVVKLEDYPPVAARSYLAGYNGEVIKQQGDVFTAITHADANVQQFVTSTWRFNGTGSLRLEGMPYARLSEIVATDITMGDTSGGSSGSSIYSSENATLGVLTSGGIGRFNYSPISQAVEKMMSLGLLTNASMAGRAAPAPRATPTPSPPPPTSTPTPVATVQPPDQSSGGGSVPLLTVGLLLAGSLIRRLRHLLD